LRVEGLAGQLKNRSSQNSSVPLSTDQLKKPSDKSKPNKGKKRSPKYNPQAKRATDLESLTK
jgi:hypothetical protein